MRFKQLLTLIHHTHIYRRCVPDRTQSILKEFKSVIWCDEKILPSGNNEV